MTASPPRPHITVCICTFQRLDCLGKLLLALENQETNNAFSYSIVVADNDATRSAEATVARFAESTRIPIRYVCEPQKNIALARNRALAEVHGEFIAFIDDDEFPGTTWLQNLLQTCQKYRSSGVLGPVRPHFDGQPPAWILKGKMCERSEHHDGHVLEGRSCRTGNALIRREVVAEDGQPFDARFAIGGEDRDFFTRKIHAGHVFVWCASAPVHETVPPSRWLRSYHLGRALLRGQTSMRHRDSSWKLLVRSAAAIPVYLFSLPFCLFAGHHIFMRNCIRLCDHLGRVLALVRLHPISEREM